MAAYMEVNHMSPTQEVCSMQEMFCFAALTDANTGTMYTNLNGAFPIRSFKNMQYIFVAYISDLNAIIIQPMQSCTNAAMITAFTEVFAVLRPQDYHLALNVMDNECSKAVEKHIRSNRMDIQLIPPHNRRVKAAERAIATFKEHFVAALAIVDMLCLLQLWDTFLPQVKLMLNLLRFAHWDLNVSANQELYGALNFDKMPLAPLGTKALVYDDPTTQASWAPHAANGFFCQPGHRPIPVPTFLHPCNLAIPFLGHMAPIPYTLPTSGHIEARQIHPYCR